MNELIKCEIYVACVQKIYTGISNIISHMDEIF